MKYFLIVVTSLIFFTACSSKKYFQADNTLGTYSSNTIPLGHNIISFNKDGATLDNGEFITKKGISKTKLPKNFEFINLSEGDIISTNYLGKIFINKKQYKFSTGVISASKKGNILALLFVDNSIALYDIKNNKILMKEYNFKSLSNDTRIANPYFMDNLILFPTLDGKIVVVSSKTHEILKTIVVDANGKFNNIIFLKVINNSLIAATSNKILSFGENGSINFKDFKDYSIRNVISHKNNLYISTIDGQIIKTNLTLKTLNEKKYKYAKFFVLAYGKSLYALESQGYLINISDDFKSDKIYRLPFNNKKKVISINNKIYINDKYFIVK